MPAGSLRAVRQGRRNPSAFGRVDVPAGSWLRVPALMTISPAAAALSMAMVVVAAGPATTSSRCDPPTRKRWMSPLCTPIDIRRGTLPQLVGILAASRSAERISTAALQAWTA